MEQRESIEITIEETSKAKTSLEDASAGESTDTTRRTERTTFSRKSREDLYVYDNQRPTYSRKSTQNEIGENRKSYSYKSVQDYEKTLKEWEMRCRELAFIYDYAGSSYRYRLNVSNIVCLVLTSLSSLLALGSFGLSENEHPELAIAAKVATAVLAVGSAIGTGLPRVLSWGTLGDTCITYCESIQNLSATIIAEKSLPAKLRTDYEVFITTNHSLYHKILGSAPTIPNSMYKAAKNLYTR